MSNLTVDDDLDRMTAKQAAFVREYVVDYNATQAAIRAGYSEATAQAISSENLSKPIIKAAVARRMAALAAAAEVDATLVVSELYQLAMADPRDLMRVEIDCCPCCYGIDFDRQWTPDQYRRALNKTLRDGQPAPEMAGGIGYDPRRPPVESCPECFGRGIERVTVTDSRKLSRGAARLMASVKQSKDGSVELKTLNQQDALMALARITGALKDRTEISGPGGGPLQLQPVRPDPRTLSNDELRQVLQDAGHPLVLEGVKRND